jgi:gamma-glutamylcyclotransferase (GGCT)/AIG2-like uncharacterized protein YtfP
MPKSGYVFVYGTLKVGGALAWQFDHVRLNSQKAQFEGTLLNLGPFPAVVPYPGRTVCGELHEYGDIDNIIEHMDSVEGYVGPGHRNNLFERREVIVTAEDGKEVKAIIYMLAHELPQHKMDELKIESGVWELSK